MNNVTMTITIPPWNSVDSEFEEFARHFSKQIGRGITREVFEIPDHPDTVLKVMHVPSNYSNWVETFAD